jgi:hypothetical protein
MYTVPDGETVPVTRLPVGVTLVAAVTVNEYWAVPDTATETGAAVARLSGVMVRVAFLVATMDAAGLKATLKEQVDCAAGATWSVCPEQVLVAPATMVKSADPVRERAFGLVKETGLPVVLVTVTV